MTKKSKKNIVTFEKECNDVDKISAATLLDQRKNSFPGKIIGDISEHHEDILPKKRKRKSVIGKIIGDISEHHEDILPKKRKRKSVIDDKTVSNTNTGDKEYQEQVDSEEKIDSVEVDVEHKMEPKESIRKRKREKHAQLLEIRKSKADQSTQQLALNYLSKWKHARNEWKFEKLRQIWLSENLFNSSKIPDDMWFIAVEYFSSSKGFIRKLIIREAMKVIDAVDPNCDDKEDSQTIKLNRARDIVQNLTEIDV